MSKLICEALACNPQRALLTPVVSASFQAALTPWILTLSGEKYRICSSVVEIKCASLSPTFQFTRSLSVYLRTFEEQQQFMNTDLCAPLFSHLKTLIVVYASPKPDGRTYTALFDHGNNVADFILKFQRLEKFELHPHPHSTTPSELINFYVRLFHSRSITQALLVSVVDSYAINIRKCCSRENKPEYSSLVKKHKIIPHLVQRMVEIYRNDHGETLSVFVEAIQNSFIRSGPRTESDSIDELVPMFDLIQTIVINGDLLHSCFQPQQKDGIGPDARKWAFAWGILRLIVACFVSADYSRLEFMQRYGRTLLPQLTDFIYSKYDGSLPALETLTRSNDLFFRLIDDYFWTDEVESRSDVAGLKKMLEGGHKLLQHIPFDKLEFSIKEAIERHCSSPGLMAYFSSNISDLRKYCSRAASLNSPELKDAVVRDVAQKLTQYKILPLCFDFIVSPSFKYWDRVGKVASVIDCISVIRSFLMPSVLDGPHLDPLFSLLRKDFFSRDGIFVKMLKLADTGSDHFEGAVRCVIQKQKDSGEWSAEDLKNAKAHYRTVKQLFNSSLKEIKELLNVGKKMLEESTKVIDRSDERTEIFARIEHAVARSDGLKSSFKKYCKENSEVMKLME